MNWIIELNYLEDVKMIEFGWALIFAVIALIAIDKLEKLDK